TPPPTAPLTVVATVTAAGDHGTAVGARTLTVPTSGTASLTVATAGDQADEPHGTITLTLNAGSGWTVSAASATAAVAVADDDPPADPQDPGTPDDDPADSDDPPPPDTDPPDDDTPPPPPDPDPVVSITAGPAVTEGQAAAFTLTASPAPAAPLTVTVTVAQQGDFGTTTGARTVTVPTTGTASLAVATVGDRADEPDGAVTATLKAGSGYAVSTSQGAATVAVADDDATAVTLAAAAGGAIAEDGGARQVTVTLGRALAAGETLTAPLTVTGAAAGSHYTLTLERGDGVNSHVTLHTAAPHSAQNPAVRFAAGARTATLVLTAVPNGDTDERTVRIAFGTGQRAPAGGGLSGGVATAGAPVGTAITNDDPPPGGPALSVRDTAVAENGRSLRLMVYLSETPDTAVTVRVTTRDRTARNGADYRGYPTPSRTLRFAAGTRLLYRYVYIPILDDDRAEGDETFQAVLTHNTGAPIAHGTATVTITDND
ncbi:MAG: hypothetical protein OXF65_00615, partial [Acidimicrobiaceae bacterium]|nr:hypothetical protein [Acidimicrobiaceae bacterium]